MPSPVGHALGGALVGAALAPWGTWNARAPFATVAAACRSRFVIVTALSACLPDLDFAWGRHNMETHSLGAAVAAGLLVWAVFRGRAPRLALAVTLAWLFWLHPRLDALLDAGQRAVLDDEKFYALHRIYLVVATVQWLAGLVHLISLQAGRKQR